MAQLIVQIVKPFLHLPVYWILFSLFVLAIYLFFSFLKSEKIPPYDLVCSINAIESFMIEVYDMYLTLDHVARFLLILQ